MPNIVQLWDFEDGTTQGWELGDNTTLDDTGAVQGTYSLKKVNTGLVARISGIDLSSVSYPVIIMIVRDVSSEANANYPWAFRLVVKDSSGTVLIDKTVDEVYPGRQFRALVGVDIKEVAGKSDLTIEIYEAGTKYSSRIHYYDQIAIIDGADEENVGLKFVPSSGGFSEELNIDENVSSLGATKIGIALMNDTSNLNSWTGSVTWYNGAETKSESISSGDSIRGGLITDEPDGVDVLNSYSISAELKSSDNPLEGTIRFVVALLDDSFNYLKIYSIRIMYNILGLEPSYFNSVSTTTYGSTVSGNRIVTVHIPQNISSADLALHVKFLEGDNTVVSAGSVTMEVWDEDMTTNYGSSSVDLTSGNDLAGSYVAGLAPGDYKLKFSWSISADARIVLKIDVRTRVTP